MSVTWPSRHSAFVLTAPIKSNSQRPLNAPLLRFGSLASMDASQPALPVASSQPWWHWSSITNAVSQFVVKSLARPLAFVYFAPSSIRNWIPSFVTSSIRPSHFKGLCPNIQPVTIPSLDKTPLQLYWLPSTKPSKISVILGHGYYGDISALIPLAQALNERGVNACLMEFRAHGKSGGRYTSLGYHEGQDLAAVADWIKTNHADKARKLLYMGHSMGAATPMLMPVSLANRPDVLNRVTQQLDGMILDSPYAHIRPKQNPFVTFLYANRPTNPILGMMADWVQPSIKRFFSAMADEVEVSLPKWLNMPYKLSEFKPAEWLSRHALGKKPILLMHAPDDGVTGYDQSQINLKTLQSIPGHQVTFAPILKGGHFAVTWKPKGFLHKCVTLIRGDNDYLGQVMKFIAPFKAQSEEPDSKAEAKVA